MRSLLLALCRFAALVTFCAAPCAAPAAVPLTIDDIVAHTPVTGNPPTTFTWSPDGSRYVYAFSGSTDAAPPTLFIHDMRSGNDVRLRGARSERRGSRSRPIAELVWSPDSRRLAFVDGDELDVADANGADVRRVARDVDDPAWSPDGSRIAYVRDRDLFVLSLATGRETRVTHAATATITNGDPDWLYSEELDVAHAFAWSPDGAAVAYLSFDESPVTNFPIQQFLEVPDNTVERQRYPLAGEANPRVSLHVVSANGTGERLLYDGATRDEYLVSFVWTPDGTRVVDEILDRAQKHLRLDAFPRAGGAPRTLLAEADARFVDVSPAPRFIDRGHAFLWISERAEVAALYRVDTRTGAAVRLSGGIPIAGIAQVDEAHGRVYATALYPTRREHALLAVALDGRRAPVDVTPGGGSHAVAMPERGTSFIDTASTALSPPEVVRRDVRGTPSRVVFRTPSLARFALAKASLFEIDSAYGKLDATLIVPADFDPARRYPVVVNVYGGPLDVGAGAGAADDRWRNLFADVLAQHGILSLYVSGPPERNDRTENVRTYAGEMGAVAIRGPIAAVDWLRRRPFVDPKRIGLFGWSYGGYLTAYTLTHAPALFASGIAGAPPVDWRFYDTAYTERYLGLPRSAPQAYARAAVLPAVRNLRASLLLLQGSSDDNVHLANTMTLLAACVRAGKPVDYFVFPGERHGPRGTLAVRYLERKMLTWWERELTPQP